MREQLASLTTGDIMMAAVAALFVTWFILNVTKVYRIVTKGPESAFRPQDIARVMERCCRLFPREVISFRGKTFTRGMNVRVRTDKDKVFEGRLIGVNRDNILCMITDTNIVAHEMERIVDMSDAGFTAEI